MRLNLQWHRACLYVVGGAVFTALLSCGVQAQEARPTPPGYRSLRYEEDWSFLRDPGRRSDPWDRVKYIPLNRRGDHYLTLGGEVRQQYERYANQEWGQEPLDVTGYLLQRYMFHTDWHFGKPLRVFTQIKSGLLDGRIGGPGPADEDELDLHQAFADWVVGLGQERSLTLRAGRQEMAYGSQRLIAVREGPNVRQSFDGFRALANLGAWRVDGLVTRPVQTRVGRFDDGTDSNRALWGVYATGPLAKQIGLHADLYYLGYERQRARFDQATAYEQRHSLGTRLFGRSGSWDYNFEAVYQWGRFGSAGIHAWTATVDTGHTFSRAPTRPRLAVRTAIISGDRDPDNPDLQTFNPLFPRGNYFGESAVIGPLNLIDVYPYLEMELTERVNFLAGWDFFWRESTRDGVYGNGLQLLRSGRGSGAREIGSELSFLLEWHVERHLTASITYSRFFAGRFLRETEPGRDIDFFSTWLTYRF